MSLLTNLTNWVQVQMLSVQERYLAPYIPIIVLGRQIQEEITPSLNCSLAAASSVYIITIQGSAIETTNPVSKGSLNYAEQDGEIDRVFIDTPFSAISSLRSVVQSGNDYRQVSDTATNTKGSLYSAIQKTNTFRSITEITMQGSLAIKSATSSPAI